MDIRYKKAVVEMKLEEVAKILQRVLLRNGFIIHRYDAYSTNSIYLKLDYGAMNSIRISDHAGKKHLKYKYNVILNYSNPHWEKDNDFWRYYCGTSMDRLNELINIIINDKFTKKTYGGYDKLMEKYKQESRVDFGDVDFGFWSKAEEVKLDEPTPITKTDN